MTRLEDLKPGAAVRGILPGALVTVLGAKWFGDEVIESSSEDVAGWPGNLLVCRDNEPKSEGWA